MIGRQKNKIPSEIFNLQTVVFTVKTLVHLIVELISVSHKLLCNIKNTS